MSHKPFSGVITAIITPFKQNGDLDLTAFRNILELQKKSGVHGVVVLGTTGESPTLSNEECEQLLYEALCYQDKNFHIYAGAGSNDTKQTINKAVKYSQLNSNNKKIDGVMVVTPYYNKPNGQHLVYHYRDVCQSVQDTPFCIYNVPGRTGINITPQILVKIALENKNVVAIKEAAGNLNAITEMRIELNQVGKTDVTILSGDDPTFAPALICGANGLISVTTNVIPEAMLGIYNAMNKGNVQLAQELHLKTYCINSGIFVVPNPVGIKWFMAKVGLCENKLRAPLYSAEGNEEDKLKSILSQLENNNVKFINYK